MTNGRVGEGVKSGGLTAVDRRGKTSPGHKMANNTQTNSDEKEDTDEGLEEEKMEKEKGGCEEKKGRMKNAFSSGRTKKSRPTGGLNVKTQPNIRKFALGLNGARGLQNFPSFLANNFSAGA